MSDPIFYTAELDFAGEAIDNFIQWYAGRHAPDLFRAHFQSCACYRAIDGGPAILDAYQAQSWDVFLSTGYGLRAKDPYAAKILAPRGPDYAATVYAYSPMPSTLGEPLVLIDSDWASLVRFDLEDAALDTAIKRFDAQAAVQWRQWGARNFRFIQRTKNHPTLAPSPRPSCALFVEWDQRPPALALQSQSLRSAMEHASTVSGFVGYRVYPWPDNVDLKNLISAATT